MTLEPTALAVNPAIAGLAAALAVGLVIGLERGWREREQAEGSRVAGLRTFTLIGLLGGVSGALSDKFGVWPLAVGLFGVTLLGAVSYREWVRVSGSLSATSAIAAMLAYMLGAMAASGSPVLAVGAAVIVAVLLDLKPTLHRWLRLIEHRELSAALQLLVLSVVVLPWLPDRGYGPYDALNPYQLWWAVVLVVGLSLAGHVATRFTDPQRGTFWTGMVAGLASSTAATLALSRRARDQPALMDSAIAGTLAACGVMFLRVAVIVTLLQPGLGMQVGLPLVASGVSLLVLGMLQSRRVAPLQSESALQGVAPFDLSLALGFAALLGLMAVLTHAAKAWSGEAGLYALAALSGLFDVDAIVVSVVRLPASGSLPTPVTVLAIGLAVAANTVAKAGIAWLIGGAQMGRRLVLGNGLAIVVGIAAAVIITLVAG